MSKNHYPGANITTQYWGGKFIGSTMNTNCACIHTTETGNAWPGYGGGASAPHMTIRPNIKAKTVDIRQHFPAGKSARALVNLAGGVETNTLGVFQIELIGTCDSKYRVSRKEWGVAGVDYIYWPDAPDWLLKAIAPVFVWLDKEWADFKLADAAPRGWVRYPDSYGINARQRMTFAEWRNAYGIFGHQHVPENCVDPDTLILMGDLTWRRAGDLVTGDRLVGFDEENVQVGATAGRRFREALATVYGITEKDCYRVTMNDGREVVASADHKWLVNLPYVNRGSRIVWVETQDLNPAMHLLKSVGEPWVENPDREAGWVAGAIDCDGAVVFNKSGDAAVLFGQSEGRTDVMTRFRDYLIQHKVDWYEMTRAAKQGSIGRGEFTDLRVKGGLWSMIRFLAQVGPEKFEAIRDNCWINRVVGKTTATAEIRSIEHLGVREVVSLETSARTYIANGLLCHNSHGDPGNFPIAKLVAFAKGQTVPPPPVVPKPPVVVPPPVVDKDAPVETFTGNLAGYDTKGKGQETRVARAKTVIPQYLATKSPTWWHFQECAIDMVPELDKRMPRYARVAEGGKGRESYYRKDAGIFIIEAVLLNVTHMRLKDTKEHLVIAWEMDGRRGVDVNFHNENEGSTFQTLQLRDVMTNAREMADKHGIPRANILVTGDANLKTAASFAWVQRWTEVIYSAKKKVDLQYKSTNDWVFRLVTGSRIDVDITQRDAVVLEAEQHWAAVASVPISDHWFHRVIRRLVQ